MPGQLDFLLQRHVALLGEGGAKQVGEIQQHVFGDILRRSVTFETRFTF